MIEIQISVTTRNCLSRNQSKLDNSITEIKANLEAMNSRLNNREECISDLEDRIMESTQSEQQKDKWKKKKATYKINEII